VAARIGDRQVEVPYGTPVGEVLRHNGGGRGHPAIAAIVHQRCVDLSYPLCSPTEIRPVDYTSREGVLVYRRTASIICIEAARQLFPGVRVSIGQALGNGYFYDFRRKEEITAEEVARLDRRMREMIKQDLPLTVYHASLGEARELLAALGFVDKLSVLKTWWEPFVPVVRFGGFVDLHHYPVAPSAGVVRTFELLHQPPGFILRFPPRGRPQPVRPFEEGPKLFSTYRETRQWNEILGVENVGQLNELIVKGEAGELIRIAEGLHEKKIAAVADRIAQAADRVKLVLIAGPSASGKTTFSKRLSLQLRVNGIRPVALSMDNFYVNREDTPKDDQGNYDFESIDAIDLALFNDVLAGLLRGEKVLSPRFDFTTGLRRPRDLWIPMQLEAGQVLVVEGIHGLNDRLTQSVAKAHKFKIYVSALTQLCIDDHNRIFTSDSRFLRRIVRDRRYRGYSAAQTIENWPAVRRGEQRNIFPYQEQADVMFNSALVYEQAALRPYAERFLLEVPQDHPAFIDAYRLLKFVSLFVPIFEESVPQISILREFIGGSAFKY
jgi:uridine kinase